MMFPELSESLIQELRWRSANRRRSVVLFLHDFPDDSKAAIRRRRLAFALFCVGGAIGAPATEFGLALGIGGPLGDVAPKIENGVAAFGISTDIAQERGRTR